MAAPKPIMELQKPGALSTVDLYEAPQGRRARVRAMALNSAAVAEIVQFYVQPAGGASTIIVNRSTAGNTTTTMAGYAFYLNEGDKIRCASSAGNVQFLATGMEEDIPRE